MNTQQTVMFQGQKYLVLEEKGNYVLICKGDYDSFGQVPISVLRSEVTFL